MLFVISIVPFLSAVAITFLYVSGFWMAIISWGRLFHALMLLVGMKTCMRLSWLVELHWGIFFNSVLSC